MKIVIQVVTSAKVLCGGAEHARIGQGYVLLVGISRGCTEGMVRDAAAKVLRHQLFGKWKKNVMEAGGEVLALSQFTLFDACRKRKPSFHQAEEAGAAREKFDLFCALLESLYSKEKVKRGVFQSYLEVELTNAGPLTVVMEIPHPACS